MRGSLHGKSGGRNRKRALGASETSLGVGEALLLSQIRPHFPSVATRGRLPRCHCGPGGLTFPAVAHSGGPAVLGGAGLDPVSSQMGSFPGCGPWLLAENCFSSSDRCGPAPQNTASGFRGESEFRSGLGAALHLQASSHILPLQTFPMSCIPHRPPPIFCISRLLPILHLQASPPPFCISSPPHPIYPAFIPPTFLTQRCRFSCLLFPWVQKWSPEDPSMSSSHVF